MKQWQRKEPFILSKVRKAAELLCYPYAVISSPGTESARHVPMLRSREKGSDRISGFLCTVPYFSCCMESWGSKTNLQVIYLSQAHA